MSKISGFFASLALTRSAELNMDSSSSISYTGNEKNGYSITVQDIRHKSSPSPTSQLHAVPVLVKPHQQLAQEHNAIAKEGQSSKINVIIQLLYHIRAFRELVNKTSANASANADTADTSRAAAVSALQRIFHDLASGPSPTYLGDLTPIIGWDDRFEHGTLPIDYDFASIVAQLEARLGRFVTKATHRLFHVTEKTYLHSYTPLFKSSSRVELSMSTLLDIHGHKNLQESLQEFIRPTPIYENEKLESTRTRTIEGLPPVWMIDLRRYQYWHPTASMVVYRHRHEFPETLDAAKYLSNFADYSESWRYRLHGVVVFEKSTGESGNFSLYFKPRPEQEMWYKFDNNRVTEVPLDHVFEGNFGQGRPDVSVKMRDWNNVEGRWRYPRAAETLIYVRESRLHKVFGPEL